jgi:membrane-bound lytic murein transglycosylase A
VALDRRIFPPSALTFVATQKPLSDGMGKATSWVDLRRFMLNQDTGGAITGAGRADLFWGSGPYAELAAGHLKHPGTLYFLVLRPDAASP